MRCVLLTLLVVAAACAKHATILQARPKPVTSSGELVVPVDHFAPNAGTFALRYELGASFDAAKPTIMLVVDGQQFWIRPGVAAALQNDLVGPRFNVITVVPRSQAKPLLDRVSAGGSVDWPEAYRARNQTSCRRISRTVPRLRRHCLHHWRRDELLRRT
jgi:hypothetical protein